MTVAVQRTLEEPTANLLFVETDGRFILHQEWWIYEWGNPEGLGRAMNRRSEWRQIPTGQLPSPQELETDNG